MEHNILYHFLMTSQIRSTTSTCMCLGEDFSSILEILSRIIFIESLSTEATKFYAFTRTRVNGGYDVIVFLKCSFSSFHLVRELVLTRKRARKYENASADNSYSPPVFLLVTLSTFSAERARPRKKLSLRTLLVKGVAEENFT